jgi:methyl-accepting chemotaxis protein
MSAKHDSASLAPPKTLDSDEPGIATAVNVICRRRFLIDGMQSRLVSLVGVLTGVPLALLNLAFYKAKVQVLEVRLAQVGGTASGLPTEDQVQVALVIVASVIFLMGVCLVTLLETHKTAGVAFKLVRHLRSVRDGDYGTRLGLRSDDNLKAVQGAFNEAAERLQDRLHEDVETLEELAIQAEQVTGVEEAHALAERLSAEAAKRRALWHRAR